MSSISTAPITQDITQNRNRFTKSIADFFPMLTYFGYTQLSQHFPLFTGPISFCFRPNFPRCIEILFSPRTSATLLITHCTCYRNQPINNIEYIFSQHSSTTFEPEIYLIGPKNKCELYSSIDFDIITHFHRANTA